MLVGELLQFSRVIPGAARKSIDFKPAISFILPTFRRNNSGKLARAIRAVLEQSYSNIELIVVDDGSTDGSNSTIREFMKIDDRISLIEHEYNLGLPAISCYEGLRHSIGAFIAFAFDDDFHHKDFAKIMLRKICVDQSWFAWSMAEWNLSHDLRCAFGAPLAFKRDITTQNVIPNPAVLVDRRAFNVYGFYDPSPTLARLCDWDLWIRLVPNVEYSFIDSSLVVMDVDNDPNRLGNIFHVDYWSCSEMMFISQSRRNQSLAPSNYEQHDIFLAPEGLSYKSRLSHEEFVLTWIAARSTVIKNIASRSKTLLEMSSTNPRSFLLENPILNSNMSISFTKGAPRVLFVCEGVTPSETLMFEPLRALGLVRFVSVRFEPYSSLSEADILILSRNILHYPEVSKFIDAGKHLQKRIYWFIDDNFMALANEPGYEDNFAAYSKDRFGSLASKLDGIICASPALIVAYSACFPSLDYILHGPIYEPSLMPNISLGESRSSIKSSSDCNLSVFFFGQEHRYRALENYVLPALSLLAGRLRISFAYVAREKVDDWHSLPFDVYHEPAQFDYPTLIGILKSYDAHAVVHPFSSSLNAGYKNANSLITASLGGACLVASDEKHYSDIPLNSMCKCSSSVVSWADSLEALSCFKNRFSMLQSADIHLRSKYNLTQSSNLFSSRIGEFVQAPMRDYRRLVDILLGARG